MSKTTIEAAGPAGVQLSPEQRDVLNELINIGFGRAASSLSMLVNQRVLLSVPQLEILPLEQIGVSLNELSGSELVNVHQIFRGKLSGNAMLLMNVRSASILVDLMNEGTGQAGPITSNGQEALSELGNIVINAFLGAFGNLLKIHLSFTIPSLKIESLVQMLQSLMVENQGSSYAMVVKIRFLLSQRDVIGYLVIVMGAQPLESLLQAIKKEGMLS